MINSYEFLEDFYDIEISTEKLTFKRDKIYSSFAIANTETEYITSETKINYSIDRLINWHKAKIVKIESKEIERYKKTSLTGGNNTQFSTVVNMKYKSKESEICICQQGCTKFNPSCKNNCQYAEMSYQISRMVGICLILECQHFSLA